MELLIVVAILGVLAAVVIPRFTGLIGTADDEAASTELEIVQTAVVAYMAVNSPTYAAAVHTGQITADDGDYGDWLQTDTGWEYTIVSEGTVTQTGKFGD